MDYTMGHVAEELGASFPPVEGTFYASTAAVIGGQIVEVDYGLSVGTNLRIGESTSGLVKVITPGTAAPSGGRCLVITKHSARINRPVRCVLQGFVDILIVGVALAGDGIVITGGADNNGKRVWGRVVNSGGTAAMATALRCLWDGIHGFGQLVVPGGGIGDPTYPSDETFGVVPGGGSPGDDPGVGTGFVPAGGSGTPIHLGAIS